MKHIRYGQFYGVIVILLVLLLNRRTTFGFSTGSTYENGKTTITEVKGLTTDSIGNGSGEVKSEPITDHLNNESQTTVTVLQSTTPQNVYRINTTAPSSSHGSTSFNAIDSGSDVSTITNDKSSFTSAEQSNIVREDVDTTRGSTETSTYTEIADSTETLETQTSTLTTQDSTPTTKIDSIATSSLEVTGTTDTISHTEHDIVSTTSVTVIEVPQDVTVYNYSHTSIGLSWKWKSNYSKVDNFIIVATTDGVVVSSVTINSTSEEIYSYTVLGLSTGKCFNVSVAAILSNVESLPGYPAEDVCTLPGVPYNASVFAQTNTSVELVWIWADDLGGVDSFIIMANASSGDTVVKDVNSTGVNMNMYTLDSLLYGTCYNISVKAVFRNLHGLTKHVTDLVCTLPSAPIHVLVSQDSKTVTSFDVLWQWTNDNGGVDSFIVKVNSASGESVAMETVSNTSEFYKVSNLTAGSCYEVYVIAEFNGRKGSVREDKACTLPAAPTDIVVLSQTTSSINVTWIQTGGADNYIVEITDTVTLNEINYTTILPWYNIDKLPAGSCYNVHVTAVFDGKFGAPGKLKNKTCTVPLSPLNVGVPIVTTTELTVTWEWSRDRGVVDRFIITVDPTINYSDSKTTITEVTAVDGQETYSYEVTNLIAGQCYNISVQSVINELNGEPSMLSTCQYTRPAMPAFLGVVYINGTLALQLKSPEGFVDSYSVNGSCNPANPSSVIVQNNSVILTDVEPSSVCTIFITAIRGGLTSDPAKGTVKTNETKPGPVSDLRSVLITPNSIEIKWDPPESPNGNITQYHIEIIPSVVNTYTVQASVDCYLFRNLTPGTRYIVKVKAENGAGTGTVSRISVYTNTTVPGPVSELSLFNLSFSTVTIQWRAPLNPNGNITYYNLYRYRYSDNAPLNVTIKHTGGLLYGYTFEELTPGTCYMIIVTAVNSAGEGVLTNITTHTNETAPGEVKKANITDLSSRSATIEWEKPDRPNGVIVMYSVSVIIKSTNICQQLIYLRCLDCNSKCYTDQKYQEVIDSLMGTSLCPNLLDGATRVVNFTEDAGPLFNLEIMNLAPATTYTVFIYGHTFGGTGQGHQLSHTTQEDVPSTAVRNVRVIRSNSSSVTLSFLSPEEPNGRIILYTVQYFYKEYLCLVKMETAVTVSMPLTIGADGNILPVIVTIGNLRSFWEYSFSIISFTKIGQGLVWSDNITYTTDQSAPGDIEFSSVTFPHITPYRINISWDPPCYPNGIITNYVIQSDMDISIPQISTSNNMTSYTVQKLMPDSLYEFQIAAVNMAGTGNFTKFKRIKTYTDVPHAPRSVTGIATSPNNISVTWAPPDLRTGPTNYTVTVTDTVDIHQIMECHTQGFSNTSCAVNNLDEFWNYTIIVTAVTVNGTNSSALPDPVQTLPTAPGPVKNINIMVQQDATKPRTVNITWNPPALRDRNGIINKYYITYVSQITQKMEIQVSGVFYNSIQVEAQQNYTFEIFAETIANGSKERISRYIPAGAPQRPDEQKEPLIKSGTSVTVEDSTKQIVIKLPLKYLCNTSNGLPDRWGVVVTEDSELRNAQPFWGSRSDFDSKRVNVYKSWFQVKNYGSFEPYIAKDYKQRPDCPSNAFLYQLMGRNRRAVQSDSFVVGQEGNCDGVTDKYCNGNLKPGRKYQVRVFVCTQGGCTETRYSDPIVTTAEPPAQSSMIMIIIGALAAVLAFIITLVVIYIMWRKHILCFNQDKSENAGTENPGYSPDIEMTDIPYRPVKLVNFPEYVETMQKDSNLRFSEQYKLYQDDQFGNVHEGTGVRPGKNQQPMTIDHSRVKLLPLDDEEGSDYINANYMPGYHSKREYIAAQGALQCTKDDFWRMTWEQNVSVIVMLTQCVERGRRKCESYWPDTPHEPVYFGDIIVETDSESTLPDYVIRIMTMKLGAKKRKIKLIHFLKWPDFGCPETTWLLLDFVMAVRLYKPHDTQGPILVHCSAGVGRTGTFIALDHLLYRIKEHDEVDIFNLVLEMRNYRPSMVQTEDQYIFIHECISDYLCAEDEDEDLQREEVEEYLAEALYENVPQR